MQYNKTIILNDRRKVLHRSLSIPEWRKLAGEGAAPPVRIQLNGNSMFPLIRWNKDYVTIVPLEDDPSIGDIVLFCDGGTERYVVHRVWELSGDTAVTWGDNCPAPDGRIPRGALCGKVALIERGKRKITPDPRKGIRWAKFWHRAGKIYRRCQVYRISISRRIKRLNIWGDK